MQGRGDGRRVHEGTQLQKVLSGGRMLLTKAEVEASGVYELDGHGARSGWFTGYVQSTLFGTRAKVSILLVDGSDTITEKQVQIVNDFIALPVSALEHIKQELLKHWRELESAYGPGEFSIETPDDAYSNAPFTELLIWSTDKFKGRGANLCFDPEWEPEHGVSIVLWNGELKAAHDINRYFFEYETRSAAE
jgi:hypothetical protein